MEKAKGKLKVFLCHASENKPIINGLFDRLTNSGFDPWLDSEVLLPGMDWDLEIKKALRASDAVIVCLSKISVAKEGYIQKEIKYSQDIQEEKPQGTVFLIPLRLEKCDTPYGLREIQWSDYAAPDGYEKLIRGLNIRAQQLEKEAGNPKPLEEKLPSDEIPPAGDLPPGSNLPFSRNPLFTGRVDSLRKLADELVTHETTGTIINQAIAGMGGLGKTQLAVEFAYRYGKFFRGVHWLNLANPESLNGEIASCGSKMGFENYPDDLPSQLTLTLNTWKSHGPRLLILDNFEAVELVNAVMKEFNHSNLRVLITSRRSDWPITSGLRPLALEVFTKEESLAFLKSALQKRADKDDELNTLSERLGHLPLGLELASRYLNGHRRLNVSEYLEQAQEALEHASMKNWRADLPAATGHDLDLQRTFALSWMALKDETAQQIFLAAGYLASNSAIPLEIFERALDISSEACDESLTLLYGLGLLRETDSQPAIHPLLADYARGLSKETIEILTTLANTLATLAFEATGTGLPAHFDSIKPHVPVLAWFAERKKIKYADTLWNNYGYHLKMIADYSGAHVAYERAIKISPDDATYINNLGMVMQTQGDLVGARAAYERAQKIDEAAFGPDHPKVAIRVNNLGMVMQAQGNLVGARAAFERALKIDEAAFGPDHPDVAIDVNNLGDVMRTQGDFDGARVAFERAIKIWEANLGIVHPQVAIGVNNLGSVMQAQGDLVGARTAYEHALKIDEAAFGPDHPKVAIRVNNLGSVMQDQGDLVGARAALERALKIDEAAFGPDHPNVARDVNNLGSVMQDQGDLVGARAAYERALAILKKFLPPDHPDIKLVQGNLDSLGE